MAVLYYDPKSTGISAVIPPTCRPKFGRHLLLHGVHLLVQFDRNWFMGSCTPNVKVFVFFVIPKMYIESPVCRWQTHKCLGCGLCCREISRKFLMWVEPEPKTAEFTVLCAQPTEKTQNFRCPAHSPYKKINANQRYHWKLDTLTVCLLHMSLDLNLLKLKS